MTQATCQTAGRVPVHDDASCECSKLHDVRDDIFNSSDNSVEPWILNLSAPDDIRWNPSGRNDEKHRLAAGNALKKR